MTTKLTDLVLKCTQSTLSYQDTLTTIIKTLDKGSSSDCKALADQILKIFRDKKFHPPQKLLALELLQACILLNKPEFLSLTQSKLLPFLITLSQKDPKFIFPSSSDSNDNLYASEAFLNNLLNYIYLWANEYSVGPDKKPTDFAKAFYMLRDIVKFPLEKPKAHLSTPNSTSCSDLFRDGVKVSTNRVKKINLEYILNILEVIESMAHPIVDEAGLEMVQSLKNIQPKLEAILNKAMLANNESVVRKVLKINERVLKACSGIKPSGDFERHSRYRNSVPAALKPPEFDDILGLDTSGMLTSNYRQSASFFTENNKSSFLSFTDSVSEADTKNEIERLKFLLDEKEKTQEILNQRCSYLQTRIGQLEDVLDKTKKLLISKEQECAEFHCLKANAKEPAPISFVPLKIGSGGPIDEIPSVNRDVNLSYANCDMSNILLSAENCKVTYKGFSQGQDFVLRLTVLNSTADRINYFEFEVDTAFGFKILPGVKTLEAIEANGFIEEEFIVSYICATDIPPVMLLKFIANGKEIQHSVKLPVHICRFCSEINASLADLWSEWEFLVFDNEITTIQVRFSPHILRQLLRLNKHALVTTCESLSCIKPNQIWAIYQLSHRVFVMVTISPVENLAQLEVRCDNLSTRKIILQLITKQIYYL